MKRKKNGDYTYEDFSEVIDAAIKRQQYKWRLNAVKWFDFDDVQQIIKLHISKKWHMWDQRRPLEPWIGRIISNQIRNLIRNHYGNYVNPCPDQNSIDHNPSTCKICQKWKKSKKVALELKIPLSTEDFVKEVSAREYLDFDFGSSLEKLNEEMRLRLSSIHYTAYKMLYFDKSSEEDVAKFMGYKISAQKRKLGYRQVKNLKKKFLQVAMEILRDQDIIGDGSD
tara:strand:- start:3828 stop:4502 length:675 start_codon:yes stop_codon:yes gene_type:complete